MAQPCSEATGVVVVVVVVVTVRLKIVGEVLVAMAHGAATDRVEGEQRQQ